MYIESRWSNEPSLNVKQSEGHSTAELAALVAFYVLSFFVKYTPLKHTLENHLKVMSALRETEREGSQTWRLTVCDLV